MAEVLHRDTTPDGRGFGVFRLLDIPEGTPRTGASPIEWWRGGAWKEFLEHRNRYYDDKSDWFVMFKSREPFGTADPHRNCCAVLDEHAGPLLSRFRVGMRVRPTDRCLTLYPRYTGGVVTRAYERGYGHEIDVLVDGYTAAMYFFNDGIWEPVPDAPVVAISIPAEDFHRERTKRLGAQCGEKVIDYRIPGRKHPGLAASSAAWSAHLAFLVSRSERERQEAEDALSGWDVSDDGIPNATDEDVKRLGGTDHAAWLADIVASHGVP